MATTNSHQSSTTSTTSTVADSNSTGKLCKPWSRPDFQRRLRTFRASTWMDSAEFTLPSPVECARFGWTNLATSGRRNRLQCESCAAISDWNASSSSRRAEDATGQSEGNHTRRLSSDHRVGCAWTQLHCDESINHFPIKRWPVAKKHLVDTVNAFVKYPVTLPPVDELLSLIHADYPDLESTIHRETLESLKAALELHQLDVVSDSSLLCALFGWQPIAVRHGKIALQCQFCYRYIPLYSSNGTTENNNHHSALTRLSLIDQHALHCSLLCGEGAWITLLKLVPDLVLPDSTNHSTVT